MAETEPITIVFNADTSGAMAALDRVEERAAKGMTAGAGTGAPVANQGRSVPLPPPAAGAVPVANQGRSMPLPPPASGAARMGGDPLPARFQAQADAVMGVQGANDRGVNQYQQTLRDRVNLQAQEALGRTRIADQRREEAARVGSRVDRNWEATQLAQERANRTAADRGEREERTGQRMMRRIPEADRPVVEQQAVGRMVRQGETPMEALRESVNIYKEDTAQHRQFLNERSQAQSDIVRGYRETARDTISGLRQADQRDMRRFNADVSELGPNAQLRAVRQRMQGLDPSSDEFQDLRRRQGQLTTKKGGTGMNTEVLGMGNYMSLMFGGWELSSAAAGVRAGNLGARVALSPMDAMAAQLQGLQTATGGIIGGMVREVTNLVGSVSGLPSIAKFEEQATVEVARRTNIDTVRQSRTQALYAQRERDAQRTGGAYGRSQQQIENEFAAKQLDLTTKRSDVGGIITAPGDIGFAKDLSIRVASWVIPEAAERKNRQWVVEATNQRNMYDAHFASQVTLYKDIKSQKRELTEQEYRARDEFEREKMAVARGEQDAQYAARDVILGRTPRDIDKRARERQFKEDREKAAQAYGDDYVNLIVRPRQKDQEAAAELLAQRQENLDVNQLRFANQAAAAQMGGDRLGAARARVKQEFNPDYGGGRSIQGFGDVRENDPRFGEIKERFDLANQAAETDENRSRIIERAAQWSSNARQAYKPFTAQLMDIEGAYNAETEGVTDINALGRAQVRRREAAQDAAKQRAEQITDVNLAQSTRRDQQNVALDRNPSDPYRGAIVGTVGAARQEELALLRQGLEPQAREARMAGQRNLQVMERDYREGFGGQQLSKEEAYGAIFGQRNQENVSAILGGFDTAKEELNKPGSTSTTEETNKQLLEEFKNLPEAIATKMLEKVMRN